MIKKSRFEHRAKGFTILELLIATLVFSVVLMLVTAGILQMAKVYYKGVTESNTQNTARAIIDTISQAIQFSGGDVTATAASPAPNSNYAFCIGNTQYSYRLGWQVEDGSTPSLNQTWHSLVQAPVSNCTSSSAPQNLTTQVVNGRDLVGKHMRLSNLVVTPAGANSYKIQVSVIYGDNDLLNNPTAANASCKSATAGSQFCASMQLSTIVVKRVK
ncbi:MAG TPA: prepilin-type N-terminal cleavage/methylation domain-containing protein [Candidatus Pristimantibacillus sp.]|jgi:prepilin-type N-terminal cleavage/methylation domain-containing protein|nr:prepilin-type N-terminal cleavage/methylation domain-containing protein [Candidatus Pristimantibacillus sp.]